jgi:tetratricopeptide (TPR) repeat protein
VASAAVGFIDMMRTGFPAEPPLAEPTPPAVSAAPSAVPEDFPSADDPALAAKASAALEHARRERYEAALSLAAEVLQEAPGHPRGLLVRAQVHLARGHYGEALASAEECIEASAEEADCWMILGVLHQERKEPEKAVEAYERYMELEPDGAYAVEARRWVKRLKRG